MLQPTDQITVTMTANEWNQVLAQLAEGPYRIVAPLLAQIQKQAMAHDGGGGSAEVFAPSRIDADSGPAAARAAASRRSGGC